MGRPKGGKNTKPYKRLAAAEREALVADYVGGMKQTDLAAKYGVSQGAVSQFLRASDVRMRTATEAQPPTFDVADAVRLFESGRTTYEVAEAVGVSQSVVYGHLKRRDVALAQRGRGRRYKDFDRQFFANVNHTSAYWAGFIAADGCVHEENNTVSFGLHPDDRALLENLRVAARLEQPIVERPNTSGKSYVWLNVTSPQWVEALERNYNITARKSLTLRPPTQLGWEFVWSFLRGYFDGDGHASADGHALQLTCGSRVFLEWSVREVMRSHHKLYTMTPGDSVAYGCRVVGPVLRDVLPRLYEHSTPETRLARKYDRFKAGGWL